MEKIVNIEEELKKNEDDKDLDEFEKLEDELEEEKEKEDETVVKINWKKILPYVGVGLIGYILGKRRSRYVPINHIEFERMDDFSKEELDGIFKYNKNLNRVFMENSIILCRDKKRKNAANFNFYEK